jgi:hypothetical protein
MNTMEVQQKLQSKVDELCAWAEKSSRASWSIADTWDADFWAHKGAIISAIRKRGYDVSCSVNWGVTDYVITKKITLS